MSIGTMVGGKRTFAAFWTDGRYADEADFHSGCMNGRFFKVTTGFPQTAWRQADLI